MFKAPPPQSPVPDVGDAQNMVSSALVRRLQSGGSNADNVAPGPNLNAPQAAARLPTLTGLS